MTGDPKATPSVRDKMIPEFSGRRPQSFPSILGGESSDDGAAAPRPVGVGEGSCAPPTGEGGRLCVLFLRDAGAPAHGGGATPRATAAPSPASSVKRGKGSLCPFSRAARSSREKHMPVALCDELLVGLTVHGGRYLSYPGEGLVKDGLSYVANAIHNI